MFKSARRQRGTSLIEMLAGAIFFIPIALFFVNIASLTLVEQLNEHLAKDAARAAANQLDSLTAKQAAEKAVKQFPMSALITKVTLDSCEYKDGAVSVKTSIDAHVPAPMLGFGSKKLVAASFQPIVGQPAPL